ncbi:MAG: hypothetical protein C4337_03845 [Armatimonadota bacterium]
MRLIALQLENFRQYKQAQIAFDTGITAIVGANGAGKSTLVEAILWALYGARALREGTDTLRFLWSKGGTQVQVQLEFELGGRRYQVTRTPKDAQLAQLHEGGWHPIAKSTSGVNEALPKLLGMNLLQFQTSFCACQKELEFMSHTPDKRREEISRMLGYERIRTVTETLKQQTRALEAEIAGLKQGIGDPTALEQQAEQTQHELLQYEQTIQQLAMQLETAKRDAEHAALHLDAQKARKQTYQSLLQQQQLLERDQQNLQHQEEQLKRRWNEIRTAEERYRALHHDAQQYQQIVRELRQLDELAQHAQRRAELQATLQSLEQNLQQLQQERAQLLQKQHELDALQPELESARTLEAQLQQIRQRAQQAHQRARLESEIRHIQQQLELLAQQKEEYEALQQQIQAQKEKLKQLRHERTQKETHLANLQTHWQQNRSNALAQLQTQQNQVQQLRQRIQQLETLGAETECPTCGQPLGDAYEAVLQQVRTELHQAQQHIQQLEQQLTALNAEPPALIQAQSELQVIQQHWDQANRTLAQLERHAQQLAETLQSVPTLQQQLQQKQRALEAIPPYDQNEERQVLSQLETFKPKQSRAQQLQGELNRLPQIERDLARHEQTKQRILHDLQKIPTGYDPQRHAQRRQQADQLQSLYEEALQLKTRLNDKPTLKEQIRLLKVQQEQNTASLQKVATELSQLGYSEADYLAAEAAFENARQTLETLERTLHEQRSQHTARQNLLATLQRQIAEIRQRQQELEQKQRTALFHTTLYKAMQEFQKELNTRLRPILAGYASEFLSSLTGGRYTQLEIDEQFRFCLIDDGVRKTVISGGEEDVVNLSLRLALARLITEKAGQPLSLLILDEVFGSLDTERRTNVLNLLNNLRDWFEQILVISHIEEINEAAERCLWVVRDERTRTSRVHEKLPGEATAEAVAVAAEPPQPVPPLFGHEPSQR